MARKAALASTAIVVLSLTGCLVDEGRDLQPVVERVMPTQARPLAPCSHTDGLIDYPSYECAALVRGNAGVTIVAIETALVETGFRVACPSAGALVATRNDIRVTADVTQWGSLRGSAVTAGSWRPVGSRPIPRGSVALRIAATRLSDSSTALYRSLSAKGGRCDRVLPRPNPVRQCLIWWNGAVGRPTREGLPSQTPGPEAEVVAHNRVGEATCTYTVRNRRGFLRLTARFDGDWHWPPVRQVRGRAAFRPNARLVPGDELLVAPS